MQSTAGKQLANFKESVRYKENTAGSGWIETNIARYVPQELTLKGFVQDQQNIAHSPQH